MGVQSCSLRRGLTAALGYMIKRIVTSILCGVGLSSPAGAAALSPERFTTEVVGALHQALPDHTVTVTEPLRLKLRSPTGKEATAFLDNAYNDYVRDPSARADIVDRYVASLLETTSDADDLDPERIIPVIKDRAWLEEMRRAGTDEGSGAIAEQVTEDFNGDLVIVYAEDSPTSTRYFSPEDLEKIGLSQKALRSLAVNNLRRILPPVETHSGSLVSMLTAGGDYVASLLLIDDIWNPERLAVEGEIVVAVPSRDIILFTGSRNEQGLRKLQELARKTVSENSYSLTDQIFVYRDGRFQRF